MSFSRSGFSDCHPAMACLMSSTAGEILGGTSPRNPNGATLNQRKMVQRRQPPAARPRDHTQAGPPEAGATRLAIFPFRPCRKKFLGRLAFASLAICSDVIRMWGVSYLLTSPATRKSCERRGDAARRQDSEDADRRGGGLHRSGGCFSTLAAMGTYCSPFHV